MASVMSIRWIPSPDSRRRLCFLQVRQHRRVDDEGGDRGGERRELVAAGLDDTAHICASN